MATVFFPDRKSTRLNSSHLVISYAVFCLKKKTRKPRIAGKVAGLSKRGREHAWLTRGPRSRAKRQTKMVELEIGGRENLFFFNDTATSEIYTLSLHDALPI